MSNIILQKSLFKRIFNSKLTWFMFISWTVFVAAFIISDLQEHSLFEHWLPKGILYISSFLIGWFTIIFFKYNTRLYVDKIDQQNELLRQRERMLLKTNERLIRQTNFLKLVTDSFSHPFFVVDAVNYEILMANKAFYEHHGLDENHELMKNKCYELSHQFNHPCDDSEHPCPIVMALKTRKPVTTQHKHYNKLKEERIVEVTAFPVVDESSGTIRQVIEYNVDITERVNEQFILAEKEERLRKIITTSPDGIAVTDLDGKISFASEKSAQLLGMDHPNELIGKNVFQFLAPEDIEKARISIEQLITTEAKFITQEFTSVRADGSIFYQETNGSLLYDKQHKPYALVLVTRDITERKKTEERLLHLNQQLEDNSSALQELNRSLEERISLELEQNREKDRMLALQSRQAAMGEMIGNIAHQWRQPLNTINLIIFDLLEAQKHGELNDNYLHKSYNEINKVVQNMSQTIDEFRSFFKPNNELKVFNLNDIIEQSVAFTQAILSANDIKITRQKNSEIALAGYPNELMQTLINIITNAKDALSLSANNHRHINIETYPEKKRVVIQISNNGGKISTEHLEKVFDPYYTTKPEGQGTGLSLFISKTIIEKNMNGTISVENIPDGVCFKICLPLTDNVGTEIKKDLLNS